MSIYRDKLFRNNLILGLAWHDKGTKEELNKLTDAELGKEVEKSLTFEEMMDCVVSYDIK